MENKVVNKKMQVEEPSLTYIVIRYIECFCVALFVFGFLWEGTEILRLSAPQFLMLYGGTGAVVTEFVARLLSKKKNLGKGTKH